MKELNTTPVSPFVVIVLSTRGGVTKSTNAANISAFVPITALKEGKSVEVNTKFIRNDPSSARPDKLEIQFSVDGVKQSKIKFDNKGN